MTAQRRVVAGMLVLVVAAGGISACGRDDAADAGAATTPTAVRPGDPPAEPVREFAGTAGGARFVEVAGTVCAATLESARPWPGANAERAKLAAYARTAAEPARRLDRAIGTLAQQRPASAAELAPVREAGQRVIGALGAAADGVPGAPAALDAALAEAQRAAEAAQVPGCALR